jgi:outer membrane protein assembly factor BamB
LIAGNLDKTLTVLDAATGEERWQWSGEGRIKATPILHHKTLILLQDNRTVIAFRSKEGTK